MSLKEFGLQPHKLCAIWNLVSLGCVRTGSDQQVYNSCDNFVFMTAELTLFYVNDCSILTSA